MPLFTLNLTNFLGGRQTTTSENLVKLNQSTDELNIKSRPVGSIARRDGTIRYFADNFGDYPAVPTGLHKLYRARDDDHIVYVYVAPNLYAVHPNGSQVIVRNDFTPGTFMDFATMKDQAYGTNYVDLPIRAYGDFIRDAELEPISAQHQWNDGQVADGLTSLNAARSVTDADSHHSMGFSAYRFRAYMGKDLGESPFMRWAQYATRNGIPAFQVWKTYWFGFWGFNSGDPLAQNRVELNLNSLFPPFGTEKIRIYRTQVLSYLDAQGGTPSPSLPSREQIINAPYYFVDEVEIGSIYYDRKSDDDLGQLADPDPIYHQYARTVEEHVNRLWYANVNERWLDRATKGELDTDGQANTYGEDSGGHPTMAGTIFWYTEGPVAPCRVYFTYPYEPSRMESFIDVRPEDGDSIQAIKSLGPLLIVFKRNHIYAVSGVDFADFNVRLVDDTVGTCAPRSVAKYRGAIYFYSGQSVYKTDGTSVVEVGQNIREELRALPKDAKPYAAAGVHEDDYILAVAEAV